MLYEFREVLVIYLLKPLHLLRGEMDPARIHQLHCKGPSWQQAQAENTKTCCSKLMLEFTREGCKV